MSGNAWTDGTNTLVLSCCIYCIKIIEDSAQILSTNLCCKDALLEASRLLDSTWCKYMQIIYLLPLQYSNNITMLSTVSPYICKVVWPWNSGKVPIWQWSHGLLQANSSSPKAWSFVPTLLRACLRRLTRRRRARFGPKEFINHKHIIEIHRMEALPRRHLTSCWFCTSFLTSSNLLHCKKW